MGYLTFKILFIISLFQISLFSEIYILSYKIVIKNSIFSADSLFISKLMIPSKKFQEISIIELESNKSDNNRFILTKNREIILNFLFKKGVILQDYSESFNFQGSSQTTMILPPLYISLNRFNYGTYLTILQEK